MKTHCLHLKPPGATRPWWLGFMADGSWERELAGTSSCLWERMPWFWTQAPRELCHHFLTYSMPQAWMNIEFDGAVLSNASLSIGEGQACTLPMSFITFVTNVLPKESLFPLPLHFHCSWPLAVTEKAAQAAHQSSPEWWQSSAEVNTALRCQSVLPSPDKSNQEANHRDISIPLLNLPWALLTFRRLTDCSLPYQHQDSSFRASLPDEPSSTAPLKQLTFPFKISSQGKSTQPAE